MSQEFKFLFSPIQIGSMTLRNRIVSTGHATGYAENGMFSERDVYYHREKAKGGIGLTITGITLVHPSATMPVLGGGSGQEVWGYDDRVIPAYRMLAEAVHEYGAKILVELGHTGRQGSSSDRMGPPVAPSPLKAPELFAGRGEQPRELDTDEIAEIVEAFGQAAARAKEGGMDGVDLHGGHGNLIAQFMSPYANKRTDSYGGSLENRLRFAIEVLDSVHRHVGKDFVVGMRISGDELVDGGLTLSDVREIAQRLEKTGNLDFLDISVSTYSNYLAYAMHTPPMCMPPGGLVYLAAGIKEVVDLPVLCVGRINDPILAERIISDGHADLIGMTRAIICDPELSNKARQGRLDDIRSCVACLEGCTGHIGRGLPITCIQNPVIGREREWSEVPPAGTTKKVVVIGGGPAGMEAARVAALRGHSVTLLEKQNQLGGQIHIAAKAPFRDELTQITRYLDRQIGKTSVEVKLGVNANPESVLELGPDAVIVATGSTPLIPPVPGVDAGYVVSDWDVLLDRTQVGQNVIIVDDDHTIRGGSVAEFLADRGKTVQILTGMYYPGMDIESKTWRFLYQRLLEKGVVPVPHTRVKEIQEKCIIVYNTITSAERTIENVDTVVLIYGGEANNKLYRALKGKVKELYAIGDCLAPRRIEQAIYEGNKVARAL